MYVKIHKYENIKLETKSENKIDLIFMENGIGNSVNPKSKGGDNIETVIPKNSEKLLEIKEVNFLPPKFKKVDIQIEYIIDNIINSYINIVLLQEI